MILYNELASYKAWFDNFEAIAEWEPDINEDGKPVDSEGNIIEDVAEYKESMIQAWEDTLESIEGDFDSKAENIACYIKEQKAIIEVQKKEKQNLTSRIATGENKVKYFEAMLIDSMTAINKKKIDRPRARISLRNNAESVQFADEKAFTKWADENAKELLRYKPELNKTAIKEELRNGKELPGAKLGRSVSVIIK